MYQLASIALAATLGVAGLAQSSRADANPYVCVGGGCAPVTIVEPVRVIPGYAPVYWNHGHYWHRDFYRYHHGWYRR